MNIWLDAVPIADSSLRICVSPTSLSSTRRRTLKSSWIGYGMDYCRRFGRRICQSLTICLSCSWTPNAIGHRCTFDLIVWSRLPFWMMRPEKQMTSSSDVKQKFTKLELMIGIVCMPKYNILSSLSINRCDQRTRVGGTFESFDQWRRLNAHSAQNPF